MLPVRRIGQGSKKIRRRDIPASPSFVFLSLVSPFLKPGCPHPFSRPQYTYPATRRSNRGAGRLRQLSSCKNQSCDQPDSVPDKSSRRIFLTLLNIFFALYKNLNFVLIENLLLPKGKPFPFTKLSSLLTAHSITANGSASSEQWRTSSARIEKQ